MSKLKIYLETTVFNFYLDEERGESCADTRELFRLIVSGKIEAFTSEYTTFELRNAPEPKRSAMFGLISKYNMQIFSVTPETETLADSYVDAKIIPAKYRDDAAHIAAASLNGMDCIVSYNFKHINKLKTKIFTQNLNHLKGCKGLVICTAKEIIENEKKPH